MTCALSSYLSMLNSHRRVLLVAIAVATLALGSGLTGLDGDLEVVTFEAETEAGEDLDYIEEQFATDRGPVTVVVLQDEDVITKESFGETLELQEQLRTNETINATLAEDRPTVDSGTVFLESTLRSLGVFGVTLDDKQRTFRTVSDDELTESFPEMLEDDNPIFGPGTSPSTLLPADHDGTASADSRLLLVRHSQVSDQSLLEAQLTIEQLADEGVSSETFVFGQALVEDRASDATGETFGALGPFALFFLVLLLAVAYRNISDIVLGLVGVVLVLVWTGGFLGWSGIALTQLLVAVPWLLLGLAIDYGLHVLMRYREAFDDGARTAQEAMSRGLRGVLVAIGVTSLTTAGGFLSGAVGPAVVREFGLVAAFGILSAFVIFAVFVPACKLELAAWGISGGRKRPISRLRVVDHVTSAGIFGARRVPIAVVLVVLLVATGGAVAATQVDTATDRSDFLPGDPPSWATAVPGIDDRNESVSLEAQATFLDENFEVAGGDDRVEFLIRGAVTDDGEEVLETIESEALNSSVVRTAEGEDAVYTPLDSAERFAAFDSDVETALDEGNLTAAFDGSFDLDEETMRVTVAREDGEYDALRVVVAVESGASARTVTDAMRPVADSADSYAGTTVAVTGDPVVTAEREQALLRTLVESFVLALVVTFSLLVALFWYRYRAIDLGVLTVAPVIVALSLTLGTMYALELPYNTETAIITGIAIGLGVDYTIHVSTRFEDELREGIDQAGRDIGESSTDGKRLSVALERAVGDTGGTLFASAFTTILALAVLLATFVPSLQRFALVMILVVVYAFLAAVLFLPSLLVIRERWRRF